MSCGDSATRCRDVAPRGDLREAVREAGVARTTAQTRAGKLAQTENKRASFRTAPGLIGVPRFVCQWKNGSLEWN